MEVPHPIVCRSRVAAGRLGASGGWRLAAWLALEWLPTAHFREHCMRLWPLNKTMKLSEQRAQTCCSFCGRAKSVVGPMVEGPNSAFICADCVRLAARVADANAGKSLPAGLELNSWLSAHMNFVCYVRVDQDVDGGWTATLSTGGNTSAQGSTAKDAVRHLQAKLLTAAAEALSRGDEVGPGFSNHYIAEAK